MPRALLSVYDKRGLVEFARGLADLGWELLASGGTAELLSQHHIPVMSVADYTRSPEILGGRVKTLHPAIHGGLLARPRQEDLDELSRLGWGAIDLAVVNLYPFEDVAAREGSSAEEIIENIDIGGVALIRAAAKNFERVTLLCDAGDYDKALQSLRAGGIPLEMRRRLALKGFSLTARYDSAIAAYLSGSGAISLNLYPLQALRYGENPHQAAGLYGYSPDDTPLGWNLLQGKELSYNNLLDLDAAWRSVSAFERPSVAIVKHLSPCGIASAENLAAAYQAALESDQVSAFGGVIAANRRLDAPAARAMSALFIECLIAPGYEEQALGILSPKKNLRLVEMPPGEIEATHELRSILGGVLRQQTDQGDPPNAACKTVTARQPDAAEWVSLKFAWKACQHVRSNAIVIARGETTLGIGGGQPNRIDSLRTALQRAGERAKAAVMASDGFFPFPDCVELAAEAGISAIIQPGGSIRDGESIDAADVHDQAMVFTGVRHFRH